MVLFGRPSEIRNPFQGKNILHFPWVVLLMVQKSQTTTWDIKPCKQCDKLPTSTGARRMSEPSTVSLYLKNSSIFLPISQPKELSKRNFVLVSSLGQHKICDGSFLKKVMEITVDVWIVADAFLLCVCCWESLLYIWIWRYVYICLYVYMFISILENVSCIFYMYFSTLFTRLPRIWFDKTFWQTGDRDDRPTLHQVL